MSVSRIICVGNRLIGGDDAAPRVHDRLLTRALPTGVEVVDAGLAGLNLLYLLDGTRRVVFVDQVRGFAPEGSVVPLTLGDVLNAVSEPRFGHGGGLSYMLAVLPSVCELPPPDIHLVGLEGCCGEAAIAQAADLALALAMEGRVSVRILGGVRPES